MSEARLAREIGISRQAVNKMMNGSFDPPLSRLYAIADALRVSLHDLLPP